MGQHLQALALLQVWRNESSIIGASLATFLFYYCSQEVQKALLLLSPFDSIHLMMAGGFGFGAAPASTGAAAGEER